MNRRHKENTNLITIPACRYDGNYRLNGNYTMIDQYLKRTEQVMQQAMSDYRRVTMIRFDLRFPTTWDLETYPYQDCISRFFRRLKYLLFRDAKMKRRSNKLRYVWCKEVGEVKGRAHYHVTIMLNGDLYRPLRYFDPGITGLSSMIIHAWIDALDRFGLEPRGLVYAPLCGGMNFRADDYQSQVEAFQRMSYLSKARTKHYGGGARSFGYSLS